MSKSVSQFVLSLISSLHHAAGSAPNPFVRGEYKQLLQVLNDLLMCFQQLNVIILPTASGCITSPQGFDKGLSNHGG